MAPSPLPYLRDFGRLLTGFRLYRDADSCPYFFSILRPVSVRADFDPGPEQRPTFSRVLFPELEIPRLAPFLPRAREKWTGRLNFTHRHVFFPSAITLAQGRALVKIVCSSI